MSMKWYSGEDMNMGYRVLNLAVNYAFGLLSGTVIFLVLRSVMRGDWFSGLALALGGSAILLTSAIRLQVVFRLSVR